MDEYQKKLNALLLDSAQKGASDLHISPGHYPVVRIDRQLIPLTDMPILDHTTTQGFVMALVGAERAEEFQQKKHLDFAYVLNETIRFRVNAYHAGGNLAATVHVVPQQIKSIEELKLPKSLEIFTKISQGFVVVTGATGMGKSTTLASMLQRINHERAEKIITVEDPIEYIYAPERSVIDQREVGSDTPDFISAIRASLRENVNILLIGEMRDQETMRAALIAAETGHLVFTTMHTSNIVQTIERLVASFPPDQQSYIISQLADTISGTVAQRLIPSINGGVVPATEVMIANAAVRNTLRDNHPEKLGLIIDTGSDEGMVSFNQSLFSLIREGHISKQQAQFYSPNPKELNNMLENL